MDCVLQAYKDHLNYLGHEYNVIDEKLYRCIKILTHGKKPSYTYGGVVPFMLKSMAVCGHGFNTTIQHSIWEKDHYLSFLHSNKSKSMAMLATMAGNFGDRVDKINLEPAIYLAWSNYHAMFLENKPKFGVVVMAIQIQDKLERIKCHDRFARCLS